MDYSPEANPGLEADMGEGGFEEETARILHACVPGRARLHIAGLRRTPGLKETLEGGLPQLPGVRAASASTLTGNVLIHFDPALPLRRVVAGIAAVQRGEIPSRNRSDSGTGSDHSDWHRRTTAETATAFGTSETVGLTSGEARSRLAEAGANVLELPPIRSGWEMLTEQFRTLPVALLAGTAAISLISGGILEAVAVLAVVALNGIIGYGVESRSERTIRSLGREVERTASVLRDGTTSDIPAETVVPGDLLVLRRGTVVPADARIVAAHDLTASESVLTGESRPVAKSPEPLSRVGVPLGERHSMVYRGTVVTGGGGTAIAVSTVRHSEMGRIQHLAGSAAQPQTPTERQMDELGRQLVWFSLAVCGAVFGL
ncbi:MAG: hypothetical protein JOZ58_10160, partial [Acetobacteraceae bacterium]|nr:hypothetical protein [Acetobacteraceae bacterium]